MSNVTDLTIRVLQEIREEVRSLRQELHHEIGGLREELHHEIGGLREELHHEIGGLRTDMNNGFAGVNGRLDSVLKIVGSHHTGLETRVTRVEDHLGLPHKP